MKKLVDVVNLNADASCLESARWISQLQGGEKSVLYRWLFAYVKHKKKVSLGIPGASLADIHSFNPESIALIKNNPDIFELILRPFAHDNALLRTRSGFEYNLLTGITCLNKLFGTYTNFFLPPEFMCNNEQIYVLNKHKVEGIFLHPGRFAEEIQSRIPQVPYEVRGVMNSKLKCIPFTPQLTKAFLDGIHHFNADSWNEAIGKEAGSVLFCWRDGESAFLLPDSAEREEAWLDNESKDVERCFLRELKLEYKKGSALEEPFFKSYPLHSFAPWLREMRMIGFTNKVQKIEELLDELDDDAKRHWLQVINSDILSSVEKSSPQIEVSLGAQGAKQYVTLWRTERGFEGEEYLSLLKDREGDSYPTLLESSEAHMLKFKARMRFLEGL